MHTNTHTLHMNACTHIHTHAHAHALCIHTHILTISLSHTHSLTHSLTHPEKKTLRDHYKYTRATDALTSTVTYTAKFQHIYVKSYVYV